MSTANNSGEKLVPDSRLHVSPDTLIWIIIVLQFLVAICAFPFLPAVVPTHWNSAGQVDGHASKWINTILFPLLSVGLYVLIRGLSSLGPRLGGRETRAVNAQLLNYILVAVLLFELILQICITAFSLGLPIDVSAVAILGVGVLFIFIGNYMGKMRRNFWMGIRTPWTLTSETVWERTHRMGGWLFVACGLIYILMIFVQPDLRLWGLLVPVLGMIVFLYAYSYFCYRQHSHEGQEPLSAPFDSETRG